MKYLILSILLIPAVALYGEWRSLAPNENHLAGDRILLNGQLVEPSPAQEADPSTEWRTERPAVQYRELQQSDFTHGVWWVRVYGAETWLLVTEVRTTGIRAGSETWTWVEANQMLERSRTCTAESWKPCREVMQ